MIEAWPDADAIERYATDYGLDEADIVRDIVRIVSIAHLTERRFLGEDCVLTGGMALRLRGSTRFTITDTDSSLRGRLDDLELARSLEVTEGDDLNIRPDEGSRWSRGTPQLTIAKPIEYDAYFPSVTGEPVSGLFTFTVNQRGLFRDPEWLSLVYPYSELQLSAQAPLIPVMDIAEQAAEKIVAWAANGLAKHYVDLAWLGREHGSEIQPDDFLDLVQMKLDVGYRTYPAAYSKLRTPEQLIPALAYPQNWNGPLNSDGDHRGGSIRFMGSGIGFDEAKELVKRHVVPRLFHVKDS
jgi:hypothetical protein